jgi:hypothetical protein
VAGIITISPSHDASYPWRQIGTSAEHGRTGEPGAGYCLSPAEKGGEPPAGGRAHGSLVIEREVFERLYGRFIDPARPGGH